MSPSPGDVVSARVNRISGSGNGIIKIEGSEWNVGSISDEAVDEEVEILILTGTWAVCLSTQVIDDLVEYHNYLLDKINLDSFLDFFMNIRHNSPGAGFSVGDIFAVEIDIVTDDGGIASTEDGLVIILGPAVEAGRRYPICISSIKDGYAEAAIVYKSRDESSPTENTVLDSTVDRIVEAGAIGYYNGFPILLRNGNSENGDEIRAGVVRHTAGYIEASLPIGSLPEPGEVFTVQVFDSEVDRAIAVHEKLPVLLSIGRLERGTELEVEVDSITESGIEVVALSVQPRSGSSMDSISSYFQHMQRGIQALRKDMYSEAASVFDDAAEVIGIDSDTPILYWDAHRHAVLAQCEFYRQQKDLEASKSSILTYQNETSLLSEEDDAFLRAIWIEAQVATTAIEFLERVDRAVGPMLGIKGEFRNRLEQAGNQTDRIKRITKSYSFDTAFPHTLVDQILEDAVTQFDVPIKSVEEHLQERSSSISNATWTPPVPLSSSLADTDIEDGGFFEQPYQETEPQSEAAKASTQESATTRSTEEVMSSEEKSSIATSLTNQVDEIQPSSAHEIAEEAEFTDDDQGENAQHTELDASSSVNGEESEADRNQDLSHREDASQSQESDTGLDVVENSTTDNRRMTTDRFYGGVNGRLEILRQMLEHIESSNPAQDDLVEWILSNSRAQNDEAVVRHLNFINSIELIQYSDDHYSLTNRGRQYSLEEDPLLLYQALQAGVKGFETILAAMQNGPMTDEAIMDLLVGEFEECNMTTPGVAARHREWLEALGFVQETDKGYTLTDNGRAALDPSTFDGRDSEEPELDPSQDSLQEDDASQSRGADVNPEVLQELRSEAEEVATDDPSRDGVVSTTSKYVRSPAIKKYAKARAGGLCEWCEDPAPFQSKAGGPYLEVHHVEELGQGGSDSPDKVVALCPVCHTQIHYGEGGDELNAQIQQKLETEIRPSERESSE